MFTTKEKMLSVGGVMQKIHVANISHGAIIAQDIYSNDGRMLISQGVPFKGSFLSRLINGGIHEIFIEDDIEQKEKTDAIHNDPILKIQQKIKIDDVIYEKTRKQAEHLIMKTMTRHVSKQSINLKKITEMIEIIVKELLSTEDIVLSLSKLRSIDDYTYEHSVNVCVISIIIGIELFLEKDSLKDLGVGAILHDIGKVGVSERIIKKPGSLLPAEFGEIKTHTELGYQILKGAGFSEDIAQIALYHHERVEGSGYPHHLEGVSIPLYARIVAVADVYDALSNNRIYRKKMTPDNVYRELIKTSTNHLDELLVEKLLKHIHMYPNGSGVILNTGEKGVIVNQNRLMPESPVVRVIIKNNQIMSPKTIDIDLSVESQIYIASTF